MLWVAIGVFAYLGALVLGLSMCALAKRADEQEQRFRAERVQ